IALYLLNMYFGLMRGATVILIGVAVAIIGLIGDLMESLIKRYYGVKDSGKLLPGHGGILDRFDSVMLAAPMMYYCILLAQFLDQFAGFGVWFVF
ncbi:MAG: phosphatidate cytidylyltransferase, partial [Peptococcaceae bacterium]|nr:phosphatidate cytidylyltransferase [Peptococcaceae bacterium]